MAPRPPIPGMAKVIVKQTISGVPAFNIFHVDALPALQWTASELASLASAVRSAWVTNFIPLQTGQLVLNDVTAIDLSSDTGAEGSATGSTTGTNVGTALSANAAACITWKIPRRYRGGHPRSYIAGHSTGMTTNANTWTASHVTNVTNAALALRTAINAVTTGSGTVKMVCVHYRKNKVDLTTPLVDAVSGAVVDTRIDSQRRRLGRDR
jgi:hypothetical protein